MFRRIKPLQHKEEVIFPIDLNRLGYFLNEHDQIRQIKNPEKAFNYHAHKVDRVNERRREAIDECIRRILEKRFVEEGLVKEYFPPGSDPAKDRCVPILVSDELEGDDVEKVLVVVGNTYDDLGVWSVREMEGPGINFAYINGAYIQHGSIISTVQTAKAAGFRTIILNCGQNVYSPELGRAVTYRSWHAATHETPHIDEVLNRIPEHENVRNHVFNVLDELKARILGLGADGKAKRRAVYFLTHSTSASGLRGHVVDEWKDSLEALIAVESTHTVSDITHPALGHFIKTRARAYIVHADQPGTFIPDRRFGCQTFATNEIHSECIIPNHWMSLMLPWFVRVEEDPEGCNPVFAVDWAQVEKLQQGWGSADVDDGADGRLLDDDKWTFDDDDDNDEEDVDGKGKGVVHGDGAAGDGKYAFRDKATLADVMDLRQESMETIGQVKVENVPPGDETKEFGGGRAASTA
ncbi:hypothetical protein Dda_0299 [Drechslerella dactyloides]|uniref:Arb2 domain-containing protein n=1 Tax=Drechslerella dactyloides TaxID=74499 RepID=A0AAD6NMY8_DREDA|nr:hypothetical protein Dda_0299 [Drechslerella dactyloides]